MGGCVVGAAPLGVRPSFAPRILQKGPGFS